MSNGKKLVSLSESTRRNSRSEVKCPTCQGNDSSSCTFCHGAGSVSKAKASRGAK